MMFEAFIFFYPSAIHEERGLPPTETYRRVCFSMADLISFADGYSWGSNLPYYSFQINQIK